MQKQKTGDAGEIKIGTFVDPRTDFGFKRIFATEAGKEILIAFLNDLFEERKAIKDISYNNNEQTGPVQDSRNMILDLTCTGQDGEQFIIEVQRIYQANFTDRALYYSSRLIHDQAPRGGNWDYLLREVYFIGILDFVLDNSDAEEYLHRVRLSYEKSGNEFYKKLGFIFIEIPKFVKEEGELKNNVDKWLFVLKNLSRLKKLPVILNTRVFAKLFQLAAVSALTKEEFMKYEKDLMAAWDEYSFRKFAREEGLKEGLEKGKSEVVGNLLAAGKFTIAEISNFAGVDKDFVLRVEKEMRPERP